MSTNLWSVACHASSSDPGALDWCQRACQGFDTQSTTQFTIVQTTHNGEVESPVFNKVWCDAVSMWLQEDDATKMDLEISWDPIDIIVYGWEAESDENERGKVST